ncbi:MAG: hypothetical protein K0R36_1974 [Chryseobacterium sp.]|jgi:hypothetical protein|nr:hypothetical protein [Chryseobacterium sp.]
MRILTTYILLSCLLISCNIDNSKYCKEYNIENYKFCIPNNWISKENTNYDSITLLFTNKKDSIIISSGDIDILDNPIVVYNEKVELLSFLGQKVYTSYNPKLR